MGGRPQQNESGVQGRRSPLLARTSSETDVFAESVHETLSCYFILDCTHYTSYDFEKFDCIRAQGMCCDRSPVALLEINPRYLRLLPATPLYLLFN